MSERQRKRRQSRRQEHSTRSTTRRRLVIAGGLTAGATLAMSGVAHAAPETFTVGSNADTTGASDCTTPTNTDCTLRQAILDANANTPDADTIVFASALSGQTITMTADPETITEAVDIQGPGASNLTVDGAGTYRTFNVDPSTPADPVSISELTLTNGDAGTGSGGAIFNNDADLTISSSVISDSYATYTGYPQGRGGGVFTDSGPLTIDSSTISGNHAYYGGGIGALTGDVSVNDSAVTGNHADGQGAANGYDRGYGGGINAYGADVTVTRSTIDHNVGGRDGGGIYSAYHSSNIGGAVTITNSTIADNEALNDDGGGVWVCCGETNDAVTIVGSTITGNTAETGTGGVEVYIDNTSPVLENSIVSGNHTNANPNNDDLYADPGYLFDSSFDLIGVEGSYVNDIVGNQFGVDPRLGPLQDNGGPTMTMAPQCGSDAIDQGEDFDSGVDQTGATRPVDLSDYPNSGALGADGSDIGSVELQANPAETVCITESPSSKGFGSQTVGTGSTPQTFTVTSIGPDDVHIASAALVGTDAAQFSKSGDGCSGTALSTDESCTVGVSFAPSSTGAKAAQLRLTDDAVDAPQTLALSGTGVAGPPTPTPTPNVGPTGQRAAALNKCKKKHKSAIRKKKAQDALTQQVKKGLNKTFKKCKRSANQLPV